MKTTMKYIGTSTAIFLIAMLTTTPVLAVSGDQTIAVILVEYNDTNHTKTQQEISNIMSYYINLEFCSKFR